jgi:histidine triad (HIT) family protein
MSDTIFDMIIEGKVPAHVVYDDAHVLAFLDIHPLSPGHTLVIPKERASSLDELSDDAGAALGRALPRICRAIVAATGVSDYNVLQNNGARAHQAVMHVHFHIIPKPPSGAGLEIGWPAGGIEAGEAERLRDRIRNAM